MFGCIAVISTGEGGGGGASTEVFFPQDYNVIEVFNTSTHCVQNQNNTFIIQLVTMPYIMELVLVSRKTLGNGNINKNV